MSRIPHSYAPRRRRHLPRGHCMKLLHSTYRSNILCIYFTILMVHQQKLRKKKGIQVRMDADLSARAGRIFEAVGIDTPTAIRMFFVKVVVTGGIPFPVQSDPYTMYTPEEIEEIEAAYKASFDPRNLRGPFSTAKEMFDDIHKKNR